MADKRTNRASRAAHRSYYEASSVPEQMPVDHVCGVSSCAFTPSGRCSSGGDVASMAWGARHLLPTQVTRNVEAVTLRSSGSVPLMDALALERESKATRVNLVKREELDLRMELPLRQGFDATTRPWATPRASMLQH